MSDLERLTLHGIYEAEAEKVGADFLDEDGNPWVAIFKDGRPDYCGRVTPSRQPPHKKRLSDDLRDQLRFKGPDFGRLTVMLVTIERDYGPEGPYEVIATNDMIPERAFEVLRGKNIFYARHMFNPPKPEGDPLLRVYEDDGTKEGIMDEAYFVRMRSIRNRGDTRRFQEEQTITERTMKRTEPGDYFIARQVGMSKNNTRFCIRAVTFRPRDEVSAPDGNRLLTRAGKLGRGRTIHDVIMLYAENDLGVGYIPMPGGRGPYYMMVRVKGAVPDVGRYIRKAKITENLGDLIIAEKVK